MTRSFHAISILLSCLLPCALTAQKLSSLHSFTGGDDGSQPSAGLIQAQDGNFYGLAEYGGTPGFGVFFKLTPGGTLTPLYTFPAGDNGGNPEGSWIQGGDGNFYGTTAYQGANRDGIIFKLTPSGSFTLLHTFSGTDGSYPAGGLIEGSDGNFYGLTGGDGTYGNGTFYKLAVSGSTYTLTTLHSFTDAEGILLLSGLLEGADGNFYGAAGNGGVNNCGDVFSITPSGTATVIYSFKCAADGDNPNGPIVADSDGNFYGTTFQGGSSLGVVFRLTKAGVLSVLHTFSGSDGAYPFTGLFPGSDGNFYGTTTGQSGNGSLFKITPSGTFTALISSDTGLYPVAPLLQGDDGNLYGTSSQGGSDDLGSVFELTPSASLAAPVQLSLSESQIAPNQSVTLSWQILNAPALTFQQCYAFVQDSAAGAGIWSGKQSGTYSSSTKLFNGSSIITPTAAGTYTYALTCAGIESGFAKLTVSGSSKDNSSAALAASPNPDTIGQSVTLKATVTGTGATPTGKINFSVGSILLGTATLNSAGTASLAASSNGQAPGSYPITAAYSGSSSYNSSTSPAVTVVLNKAPTATTFIASPTSVNPPADVTLTATVKRSASGATGTPTGSVTFSVDGIAIGSANLNGSGLAIFSASSNGVASGSYPVKATYDGDTSDTTSASSAVTVTVQ